MTTGLLVLLTVAWSLLAFALFVGTDQVVGWVRRVGVTFDWFDNTPWGGRSTAGRQVTTTVLGALTALVAVLSIGLLFLALLVLAISPLLPDRPSPRPPAETPKR